MEGNRWLNCLGKQKQWERWRIKASSMVKLDRGGEKGSTLLVVELEDEAKTNREPVSRLSFLWFTNVVLVATFFPFLSPTLTDSQIPDIPKAANSSGAQTSPLSFLLNWTLLVWLLFVDVLELLEEGHGCLCEQRQLPWSSDKELQEGECGGGEGFAGGIFVTVSGIVKVVKGIGLAVASQCITVSRNAQGATDNSVQTDHISLIHGKIISSADTKAAIDHTGLQLNFSGNCRTHFSRRLPPKPMIFSSIKHYLVWPEWPDAMFVQVGAVNPFELKRRIVVSSAKAA
ncbi:hypothetical protein Ancab_014698 [Ancistrocladus abbreviatus]